MHQPTRATLDRPRVLTAELGLSPLSHVDPSPPSRAEHKEEPAQTPAEIEVTSTSSCSTCLAPAEKALAMFSKSKLGGIILAGLSLMTVADVVLDIISMINYARRGWFVLFGCLLGLLTLNLRFSVLYTAMHPKPSWPVLAGFFIPGFALRTLRLVKEAALMDAESSTADGGRTSSRSISRRANSTFIGVSDLPSPPPSPPTSLHEDTQPPDKQLKRQTSVRERGDSTIDENVQSWCQCLDSIHDMSSRLLHRAGKKGRSTAATVVVYIITELGLLLAGPVVGFAVITRASLILADDALNQRSHRGGKLAYSRVVTFIESLCEAAPQFAAQTYAFAYTWKDASQSDVVIFSSSASLSVLSVFKGVITFIFYRKEIMKVLGSGSVTPFDEFLARVNMTRKDARKLSDIDWSGKGLTSEEVTWIARDLARGSLRKVNTVSLSRNFLVAEAVHQLMLRSPCLP